MLWTVCFIALVVGFNALAGALVGPSVGVFDSELGMSPSGDTLAL